MWTRSFDARDDLNIQRYRQKPKNQLFYRLSTAFTNIGIDYAGPLFVNENDETVKSYVCLFMCASTRAVHLELLKDLSTNMFLMAFRRFVSRRGMPRKILTDNAKTFKAAAKEVAKICCSNNVKRYLADKGV